MSSHSTFKASRYDSSFVKDFFFQRKSVFYDTPNSFESELDVFVVLIVNFIAFFLKPLSYLGYVPSFFDCVTVFA